MAQQLQYEFDFVKEISNWNHEKIPNISDLQISNVQKAFRNLKKTDRYNMKQLLDSAPIICYTGEADFTNCSGVVFSKKF